MINTVTAHDRSLLVPSWYGKLPGTGDFAHRRMPSDFISVWDTWLQTELHDFKKSHPDWVVHYLGGSIWFFVLGKNVVDSKEWLGVMMPSVDSAGRYFPLTLAVELNPELKDLSNPAIAQYSLIWDLCAEVALLGLNQDMDASLFETTVQSIFSGEVSQVQGSICCIPQPAAGQTLWLNSPHQKHESDISSIGLPKAKLFEALFGCASESESETREVLE